MLSRPMTEIEIALVEADFRAVAPVAEEFAARFYQILFAQAPWTRALFRDADRKAQAGKLAAALKLLVASLRRPETIAGALAGLGARHAGFGVTACHYDVVARALLATLEEAVGSENWTAERMAAWTGAYCFAAGCMQEGAAAAAAQAAKAA